MQLNLFMCSEFQEKSDVIRLAEIMLENDLVLALKRGKTTDGKLGPIPYYGEISEFVEYAYHNEEFIDATEIIFSGGPRFRFEAITRLRYPEPDLPRSDYITVSCTGRMQGRNYNSITTLVNFHTSPVSPDIETPYFEDGAQLILKLGIEFYKYLKPWYGWLDYPPHDYLAREAIRDRKEFNTLYWANLFGPPYIKKFGSRIFLDSPVWKKEELPNGGIYLQLSEYYTKPVAQEEKVKLRDYFSSAGITLYSGNPFDDNSGREL